jgi:DNA-binding ferritin-like protein (Dps family)
MIRDIKMYFFNYTDHKHIPEDLEDYILSTLEASGIKTKSIAEVSLTDINEFFNMNEEMSHST